LGVRYVWIVVHSRCLITDYSSRRFVKVEAHGFIYVFLAGSECVCDHSQGSRSGSRSLSTLAIVHGPPSGSGPRTHASSRLHRPVPCISVILLNGQRHHPSSRTDLKHGSAYIRVLFSIRLSTAFIAAKLRYATCHVSCLLAL